METLDFSFKEIIEDSANANYTDTCSGNRSDCCTRVCTRDGISADSLEAWDKYLEVNAGAVQY